MAVPITPVRVGDVVRLGRFEFDRRFRGAVDITVILLRGPDLTREWALTYSRPHACECTLT